MTVEARPQWVAKMYAGKTGRDHLGLNSVSSDQILVALSPGINVLTVHPRYHSFYSFLLDEFWRRDLPRSRAAFARFFSPREFIFSVGAHLCDRPEHGAMTNIVGSFTTAGLARSLGPFDTTYKYIESDLGGYGLYYRSVMAELGFIYPGGPGLPYPMDVPTERGKALAERFQESIAETAYFRDYFAQDASYVPRDVVQAYIRQACLCQVQTPTAPDRSLLLDSFLHAGPPGTATARRATFRMLLDIASQTDGVALSQDHFRELLYFGAASDGATYTPSEAVQPTALRWRLYQAREYFAYALNALWCGLCDWGVERSGERSSLPLESFWQAFDELFTSDEIARARSIPSSGLTTSSPFADLLTWLQQVVDADGETFDARCGWDAPLNERHLYTLIRDNRGRQDVLFTAPILMLALLSLRFPQPTTYPAEVWRIARMGGVERISLHMFLHDLRRQLSRGAIAIGDVARHIFLNDVILQHQLVAESKLPENTFRFLREGAGLRFFPMENALSFMDSRYNALSTTLHELGLCAPLTQAAHILTPDGERLLRDGDLPGEDRQDTAKELEA